MINLFACVQDDMGIGYKGDLIWRLKEDMHLLSLATFNEPIVAGRKTWETLPRSGRMRKKCLVVSHGPVPEARQVVTPDEVRKMANIDDVFVLGGAQLYQEFIDEATYLYLTRVFAHKPADTFFPPVDLSKYVLAHHQPLLRVGDEPLAEFQVWEKVPQPLIDI